jgi:membrane protein implicated in regulation of membrane protease activity
VSWVVWVVIAVALAIGEVVTPGMFFLGPLSLSAGAAALAAFLGAGTAGSLIVFLIAALLSLGFLRPIARRHIRMPAISRTGTDALIGRKALVTRQIDAHGGRVKIGGEEWTARSYLGDEVIPEGATVDVIQIEGATALVTQ